LSLFGLTPGEAVFAGFLVALSSTAILMKLLMDAGEMDTPQGKTVLGILIFQDLCVVPLMLMTPFLAGAGGGISGIFISIAKAGGVVAIAHVGARHAIPWIFGQVVKVKSRELFILTIIFVGFGTAWLTNLAGLSLALGAFIAGLAISESEYSHQALGDIIPFRDAFISLFFISVGMLLDVEVFLRHPLAIALLVLAIIALKAFLAAGSVLILGIPARIAVIAGLGLAQIGEFSFILAQSGLRYELLTPDRYQLFLAASVATMALTPFCLQWAPKFADQISHWLPRALVRGQGGLIERERKMRLSDHVIVVGYGLNGRNLTKVLKGHKIHYVIIEANPYTVSTERKRGAPIVFGDAARAEVLEHAHIARARILVIAISDAAASRRVAAVARQLSPGLHIIVRTRYLLEMEPLYALGVNEVIPEELETSVEIFARVLKRYLVPHDQVEASVAAVRSDSYQMLRSVSRRHSHAVGIAGFLSGAEIGTFTVQAAAPIAGEPLSRGRLRKESGATLIAVRRGEEVVPNPEPSWQLQSGDVALLLGTPTQLAVAGGLFDSPAGPA